MSPLIANLSVADLTAFLLNNIVLICGLLVAAIGLAIFGISDIARFRLARVLAIADVCFAESIRRKVLWLVPLAVVGLIAIVQLQQPLDALDSIRQTTKYCLLTTGLVVVASTLILACTNLPREIENKVIFTVVSKPATRLEIVLGKIVGFARMSGTILLLMGLFSFGYLHFRAWILERDLKTRLANGNVELISRPTFQHYVDDGLLSAKTLGVPTDMNIFAVQPEPGSYKRCPVEGGTALVKFKLPGNMLALQDPDGSRYPGVPGMTIYVDASFDPLPPAKVDRDGMMKQPAALTIEIRDPNHFMALGREINNGAPFPIAPPDPKDRAKFITAIRANIAPNYVQNLTRYPYIYVALTPSIGNHRIWIEDNPKVPPVTLHIPLTDASGKPMVDNTNHLVFATVGPELQDDGTLDITYLGPDGQIGQRVAGDPDGDTNPSTQVAVYQYRHTKVETGTAKTVPFEFRVGVEKSGESNDLDVMTESSIRFVDPKSGYRSPPIHMFPENNRVSYGNAPVEAFKDGDFNVEVRCLSANQWLNLNAVRSLAVVKSVDSFAFNLFKANLILWLLSILVITISVFCSTFLSWPIAVVLTIVILLGRWTMDELGDAAAAGLGRTISTEFGFTSPDVAQTVSATVEHLNSTLKLISLGLPDISQFPTTDDIEQGVSIPMTSLLGGIGVLVAFGVPLTVLAYVFFKHKEVAP